MALTAHPSSLPPGTSTTISWSTQHATSCQAVTTIGDPGWSAAHNTSGSYTTATLAATVSYTLSCHGTGGTTPTTVTVTVVPPPSIAAFVAAPARIPVGVSSVLTWSEGTGASCAVDGLAGSSGVSTGPVTATTTYTLTCANSLNVYATATATVTVVPMPSITSFTATPANIPAGGSAILTWNEGTGASCAVTGLAGGIGVSTGPITTTTTYTLSCNSVAGTKSAATTVTVAPAPKITAFTANPSNVDPDCVRDGHSSACLSSTLSWTTTNAVSCAIVGGGLNRTGLPASGSLGTGTITAATTYALGCSNPVNVTTSATNTVTFNDVDDGGD